MLLSGDPHAHVHAHISTCGSHVCSGVMYAAAYLLPALPRLCTQGRGECRLPELESSRTMRGTKRRKKKAKEDTFKSQPNRRPTMHTAKQKTTKLAAQTMNLGKVPLLKLFQNVLVDLRQAAKHGKNSKGRKREGSLQDHKPSNNALTQSYTHKATGFPQQREAKLVSQTCTAWPFVCFNSVQAPAFAAMILHQKRQFTHEMDKHGVRKLPCCEHDKRVQQEEKHNRT